MEDNLLDRIVGTAPKKPEQARKKIQVGAGVLPLLQMAAEDGASDLFLIAGGNISEKVDRSIVLLGDRSLSPPEAELLIEQLYELAGRSMDEHLESVGKKDNFTLSLPGTARFRVNVFQQRGSLAAVVRVIKFGIPDWREMNIPEQVMALAKQNRGLILVTGLAASGKSVTQACLIDRINRTRDAHIFTIENSIEYLHRNQSSIVSQQEVGIDVADSLTALNDCLQRAPDVIFLAEMNDHDILAGALRAAETGRLVIGTLYTRDATETVDYLIHSFPYEQQESVRMRLSMVLKATVSQQLLVGEKGSMVPAFELMLVNDAIRGMIREDRLPELKDEIARGTREGMLSMDGSILDLYGAEKISKEAGLDAAADQEALRKKMLIVR